MRDAARSLYLGYTGERSLAQYNQEMRLVSGLHIIIGIIHIRLLL